MSIDDLISVIEGYMARKKMAATVFGLQSIGDPNLVRRLKGHDDFKLSTMTRILDFVDGAPAHKPKSRNRKKVRA